VSSCFSRRVRDSIYDADGPWIAEINMLIMLDMPETVATLERDAFCK
jgi:hypothetical protein